MPVLGFDSYPVMADRIGRSLAGDAVGSHVPQDRRLQLVPVTEPRAWTDLPAGMGPGPGTPRRRLGSGPSAPLKIASGSTGAAASVRSRGSGQVQIAAGCGDHRRGRVAVHGGPRSHPRVGELDCLRRLGRSQHAGPGGVVARAGARRGSTGCGCRTCGRRDAGHADRRDGRGGERRRLLRPVVPARGPASAAVQRYGSADTFLGLLHRVRAADPAAGVRSSFIVGFPGETQDDIDVLEAVP